MSPVLLHEWVRTSVERHGDRPALGGIGPETTYDGLWTQSGWLAAALVESGLRPGDRVGILATKSPLTVAAILGVLRAGGVYVPLDPDSPPPRLARMLRSMDDRWLITEPPLASHLETTLGLLEETRDWTMVWLADQAPEAAIPGRHLGLARLASLDPPADGGAAPSGDRPAYMMFTSGSTGVPKGVVITHDNVTAFLRWALDYFSLGPGDRVSGHSPLHFDLSVFDIFGSLGAGATLLLVPPRTNVLAAGVARFIRDHELTQWFSVPTVLNYLVRSDAVEQGDFPSLRRLLWCGEVLPTPTLARLMERLPHVRLTNLYGPTEATIASSYFTVDRVPAEDADIPIGRPCSGESLHVLDEALAPVPVGETGHLYIAGAGLSPGYWRDEEKTAQAFLCPENRQDLPERLYRTGDLAWMDDAGEVRFVGRADTQIKSRGYRIELGEIEAALARIDYVDEAAVLAVDADGFQGMALCCAHAPEGIDPVTLRAALARHLPAYMLPTRYRGFPRLPVNANGKIDRVLLREIFLQADPNA